jgi:hypothetical protein
MVALAIVDRMVMRWWEKYMTLKARLGLCRAAKQVRTTKATCWWSCRTLST